MDKKNIIREKNRAIVVDILPPKKDIIGGIVEERKTIILITVPIFFENRKSRNLLWGLIPIISPFRIIQTKVVFRFTITFINS